MSEISEAEKRRILRERRQKKLANGGASNRLNKITGQVDSHLSTESPLETPKDQVSPIISATETPIPAAYTKAGVNKESHRAGDFKDNDPQVELFKKLAELQGADKSTPDLFSLLGSLKDGMSKTNEPAVGQPQINPVDEKMLQYHDYLVNRLKAYTILIRWLILLPFIYMVVSSSYASEMFFTKPSNFFMIFTSFEIITMSIYYQALQRIEEKNNVNTLNNSSIIMKIVSMVPEGVLPIKDLKGKAALILQYQQVLSMFVTDICFVIIMVGIFSYLY
ncbi:GET complex subunit GET2 NDAI_0A03080 [Naumovozyma dairenensis CBS 421]|uniref:Golgi to ER traffic protein 2 n=1 Tax=Naumovozyma dairenensis (strain ATCC 10597 / BCRC 20456 / CBS 421 / NBRC 0211 / NRRL Y-12639) TaxID=1071378 RepID=G0W3S7_NAUDC|nr:hypothetical protein NDAI_0A03080 [Naumovozyma dairenensis CBS 421]CCD22465.1 hypothetical protein NDAI_0A03080 [Naumovozyma dairenensis CBS 421]